jgi:hypothetical protein
MDNNGPFIDLLEFKICAKKTNIKLVRRYILSTKETN